MFAFHVLSCTNGTISLKAVQTISLEQRLPIILMLTLKESTGKKCLKNLIC